MTLMEDMEIIARKEGYTSIAAFVIKFVQIDKNSFQKLKEYIEHKHKRYYTTINFVKRLRPLIPGKIKGYMAKKPHLKEACDKRWKGKANNLGYKDDVEMLTLYPYSDKDLARLIGMCPMSVYFRRKKLGLLHRDLIK